MSKKYLISILSLVAWVGFSQNPAAIDFMFRNKDERPSFYNTITQFVVQPDGKIIASGFYHHSYYIHQYSESGYSISEEIMRFNPDYTIDTSFDEQLGPSVIVRCIGLQSDGKIVVSGNGMIRPDGSPAGNLVRINPDGSYDATFQPAPGITQMNWFQIASDDKILYRYNSTVKRLNSDGSIDNTFTTITGDMTKFVFQGNKILLAMGNQLKRYNGNGSPDTTFQTSTYDCQIEDIRLATNGQILLGGPFSEGVARVNQDGSADPSFVPGINITPCDFSYAIDLVCPLPDGKMLIGGRFASYNGVEAKGFARLNQNGTLDALFPTRLNGNASALEVAPNGNILLGVFSNGTNNDSEYDGVPVPLTIWLDADGELIAPPLSDYMQVRQLLPISDGTIVEIGSSSSAYQMGIKVIESNGVLVANPATLKGFNSRYFPDLSRYVSCTSAAVQPDGKIVVVGVFTHYKGVSCPGIARLNSDYSLDTTFNPGTGFPQTTSNVYNLNIVVQPDGKILVSGYPETYNGVAINNGIIRLLANGQVDASFNPQAPGSRIAVLPDGKLLLNGISRLHPNGDLDDTYDTSAAGVYGGDDFLILPDGKIQIGASVRLNPDGSQDTSYAGTATYGTINDVVQQSDGKIIVAGYFWESNNPSDNNNATTIMRLNTDGTKDITFDAGTGFNNEVFSLLLLPEGKIMAAGTFTRYNGEWCNGTAKLLGGSANMLAGRVRYDDDANGCDNDDLTFPNMKLRLSSPGFEMDFMGDEQGSYNVTLPAGQYTITPVFENPTYFSANPSSFPISFTNAGGAAIQDICISANGVHADLEVTLVPVSAARPGFVAQYAVLCKNKGTQIMDATLSLVFPEATTHFWHSEPVADASQAGSVQWNLGQMNPTEVRYIEVTLNLNTPTDTPALNGGDILNLTASADSSASDATPTDNIFALTQTVVNSHDPNDKTCAEGTSVGIETIGDYVHYVIRFENTGTYSAQNIRVTDVIDMEKFDVGTLVPLGGSGRFTTSVTDENRVTFYFGNIHLPFEDSSNDGFVAFKIKLKNDLEVGDVFSNSASIYFDYNEAIVTDPAITSIGQLSAGDIGTVDVLMYPNPATADVSIECGNGAIQLVSIYDVTGKLMQSVLASSSGEAISVSDLSSGIYFVKIFTEKGSSTKKLIKK